MIRIAARLFCSLLLGVTFTTAGYAQTVVHAKTCSSRDVQIALNSVTADGTIVKIPAGSCHWSRVVDYTQSYSLSIMGAGSQAIVGGGDATVIIDDIARNPRDTPEFRVVTASGKSFRLTGITFEGGTGVVTYNGAVVIGGKSISVRIDHVHFYHIQDLALEVYCYGLLDHSLFDMVPGSTNNGIHIKFADGGDSFGDTTWTAPTDFGSSKFFFIEDDIFNNGFASDCNSGGRYVMRHDIFNSSETQQHATDGGQRNRGCRAWEEYENEFTGTVPSGAIYAVSGTGLVWGNTVDATISPIIHIHNNRSDIGYIQAATPNEWGYCGPGPTPQMGIVDVSGTSVTLVSGSAFSSTWPANSMILIASATYNIASVSSSISLTLDTPAGSQTGVTYVTGSAWDGNTDVTGYPCLDQLGRGKGDLLGNDFPDTIDTVTGQISWPNQSLEPLYEWSDNYRIDTTVLLTTYTPYHGIAGALKPNRDYYLYDAGFDGRTGVGTGLFSARPATCTPHVGYWAADQSTLYQCSAKNTWTVYYRPYTYPHPLDTAPPTNLKANSLH